MVEEYWRTKAEGANCVAIWSAPRTGATQQEWRNILADLELHHGEESAGAGIAGIEVHGRSLSAAARAALSELGYEVVESNETGFSARRA